jgi:hypothetical protein
MHGALSMPGGCGAPRQPDARKCFCVRGMDAKRMGSIRRGEGSPVDSHPGIRIHRDASTETHPLRRIHREAGLAALRRTSGCARAGAPPPAPPPANCAGRGENSIARRPAISREAELYSARCAGPLTPPLTPRPPLAQSARARGENFIEARQAIRPHQPSPRGFGGGWASNASPGGSAPRLRTRSRSRPGALAAPTPPPGAAADPGAWNAGPRPPERRCRRRRGG